MTTFDFNDGNGPVPAHQHPNGGGWVADTASVDKTAYVGPYARVYGSAKVYGNTLVYGYAQVSGNAEVFGNACVFGDAVVYENAEVYGYAQVSGKVTGSTASEIEDSKEPKVRVEKIAHIDIEDGHYDAVIINGVKYVKET